MNSRDKGNQRLAREEPWSALCKLGHRLAQIRDLTALKAPRVVLGHEEEMLRSIESAVKGSPAVGSLVLRIARAPETEGNLRAVMANVREIAVAAHRDIPWASIAKDRVEAVNSVVVISEAVKKELASFKRGGSNYRELLVLWARALRLEPSDVRNPEVVELEKTVADNWFDLIGTAEVEREFSFKDWTKKLKTRSPLESFIDLDEADLVHWAANWGWKYLDENDWARRVSTEPIEEKEERAHENFEELRELQKAEALIKSLCRKGKTELFGEASEYSRKWTRSFRRFPDDGTGEPFSALEQTTWKYRLVGDWEAENEERKKWMREFVTLVRQYLFIETVFGPRR